MIKNLFKRNRMLIQMILSLLLMLCLPLVLINWYTAKNSYTAAKQQNEERQMIAMKQFGVESRNIYVDKQSGRDFNRPSYRRMLARLGEGDTMVVKSIDRLGRNYDDILEQ